ncbi:MAG: sigma-70 family RNA polymerase sigma factor [Chloroflexota bacterium]
MPKRSDKSLRALCRRRIAACRDAADLPAQFEERVAQLVSENIALGRFERFMAGVPHRSAATLAEYVDAVIYHTRRESTRVSALERGDETAWNQLRDELIHRAERMVRRFRQGDAVRAAALDFAQQTCLVIFDRRYPSDVSFDAWAATILKNSVLEHFTRSSDVLRHPSAPDSLDRPVAGESGTPIALGEFLPDLRARASFERIDDQTWLVDALNRLNSRAQQQVILWTFLDELDDGEIARRLGRSKQAIYNLRQRALQRLGQIVLSPRKKSR